MSTKKAGKNLTRSFKINNAEDKKGPGNVQDLLNAGDTWKVD